MGQGEVHMAPEGGQVLNFRDSNLRFTKRPSGANPDFLPFKEKWKNGKSNLKLRNFVILTRKGMKVSMPIRKALVVIFAPYTFFAKRLSLKDIAHES